MALIFSAASRLADFFGPPSVPGFIPCDKHYTGKLKWLMIPLVALCAWFLTGCLVDRFLKGLVRVTSLLFVLPIGVDVLASTTSISIVVLLMLSVVLVRCFRQELIEARDASIELARRTLAYEALLRCSPGAANVRSPIGGFSGWGQEMFLLP